MALWAALAIGFFGSFHCIGMCGPIALALPGSLSRQGKAAFITGRILYNLGRILTYTFLGGLFGIIGKSIILAGFQKGLSIFLGLVVIGSVAVQNTRFRKLKQSIGIEGWLEGLKNLIRKQFQKRSFGTLLTIGILNGLLPCGFVYIGLAGSVTTGSLWEGALFMTLFGLGTFPAMMLMAVAPGFISLEFRQRINRIIPYLAVVLGLYLIYRGVMMGV